MLDAMIQSPDMTPDISEYATIEEAAAREDVPYTAYWLRKLAQRGKLGAVKKGTGRRAVWLVHVPSLLEYIEEMQQLGTRKHAL